MSTFALRWFRDRTSIVSVDGGLVCVLHRTS